MTETLRPTLVIPIAIKLIEDYEKNNRRRNRFTILKPAATFVFTIATTIWIIKKADEKPDEN